MKLTVKQKLFLFMVLRDSLNISSEIFGISMEDRNKLLNEIINQQESAWGVECIPCKNKE